MRSAKLAGRVAVVTGASSGIGRATALALADAGAHVVVAARRKAALQEVADACERRSGRALALPTDVTDEAAVDALARRALAEFGRLDLWVNDAAVTAFGRFDEVPMEVFRRVVEVNLFGYVHGARAALRAFREQGHGVLVNVGSMVSRLSEPYVSSYVVSKHAIRGLGQSLRQELLLTGDRNIHVCTVMPATIDTPFFQHAANYTGRPVKAMPPVYPPERVARTVLRLALRPRREVFVGSSALAFESLAHLLPGGVERLMARAVHRQHLDQQHAAPSGPGNVFFPMAQGTEASGGWRAAGRARRALTAGALLAAPALGAWWLRGRALRAG